MLMPEHEQGAKPASGNRFATLFRAGLWTGLIVLPLVLVLAERVLHSERMRMESQRETHRDAALALAASWLLDCVRTEPSQTHVAGRGRCLIPPGSRLTPPELDVHALIPEDWTGRFSPQASRTCTWFADVPGDPYAAGLRVIGDEFNRLSYLAALERLARDDALSSRDRVRWTRDMEPFIGSGWIPQWLRLTGLYDPEMLNDATARRKARETLTAWRQSSHLGPYLDRIAAEQTAGATARK